MRKIFIVTGFGHKRRDNPRAIRATKAINYRANEIVKETKHKRTVESLAVEIDELKNQILILIDLVKNK